MADQTEDKMEPNPEPEFSYEEEQLQRILIQESEKQKVKMERELREAQEREYQESLQKDLEGVTQWNNFEEVSIEEMRAVRLKRFEKG